MTTQVSPNLRLFAAEDLSKPENRANVWLIAALSVDTFWTAFASELGLSSTSVLKPMQWPGFRPDMTVFEGNNPAAIVECENFGMNSVQNACYLAKCFGLPLFRILGDDYEGSHVTWFKVKAMAQDAKSGATARQGVILDLLISAIDHTSGLRASSPVQLLDELPDNPWLKEACAPLLALSKGFLRIQNNGGEGSVSVRLLQPKDIIMAKTSGVAMMTVQNGNTIFLPSPTHLARYFSTSVRFWIDEWDAMLRQLVPDFVATGNGRVRLEGDANTSEKAKLVAGCYERLILQFRMPHGTPRLDPRTAPAQQAGIEPPIVTGVS